jgi:hypothetical protein
MHQVDTGERPHIHKHRHTRKKANPLLQLNFQAFIFLFAEFFGTFFDDSSAFLFRNRSECVFVLFNPVSRFTSPEFCDLFDFEDFYNMILAAVPKLSAATSHSIPHL